MYHFYSRCLCLHFNVLMFTRRNSNSRGASSNTHTKGLLHYCKSTRKHYTQLTFTVVESVARKHFGWSTVSCKFVTESSIKPRRQHQKSLSYNYEGSGVSWTAISSKWKCFTYPCDKQEKVRVVEAWRAPTTSFLSQRGSQNSLCVVRLGICGANYIDAFGQWYK